MTKAGLLKLSRRAATVLFWPGLALVVWGELAPSGGEPFHIWDKLLHFIAYFGLAGLANVALGGVKPAWRAAIALALLGGALEIVQGVIGRDMSLTDELANVLGVAAGIVAGRGWLVLLGPKGASGSLVGARAPD